VQQEKRMDAREVQAGMYTTQCHLCFLRNHVVRRCWCGIDDLSCCAKRAIPPDCGVEVSSLPTHAHVLDGCRAAFATNAARVEEREQAPFCNDAYIEHVIAIPSGVHIQHKPVRQKSFMNATIQLTSDFFFTRGFSLDAHSRGTWVYHENHTYGRYAT